MKIKVYQIDHEKDAWNVMFMDYAFTRKHGGVNPAVNKCVFDGNVDAGNLEEIFALLNTQAPVGYNGHSLSVSEYFLEVVRIHISVKHTFVHSRIHTAVLSGKGVVHEHNVPAVFLMVDLINFDFHWIPPICCPSCSRISHS